MKYYMYLGALLEMAVLLILNIVSVDATWGNVSQ